MTKKELMALDDGTLVYNGRHEGIIKTEDGEKVINITIPISAMSNDKTDYNKRPEWWSAIEDPDGNPIPEEE